MADGIPKYIAVRNNLRQRIEAMDPEEQLPTELELCKHYNVSRITLRHAVDNLISEGLLIREQGRGTFRSPKIISSSNRSIFSDCAQGFYEHCASPESKIRVEVIENDVIKDEDAAIRLGLNPSDELICLKRLRYVDDVVAHYSVMYLSASRFPKVLTNNFNEETLSDFLFNAYAVQLVENEVKVRVERVCESMADILNLPVDTPALAASSIVKDKFGTIVTFGVAIYSPYSGEIKFNLHSQSK